MGAGSRTPSTVWLQNYASPTGDLNTQGIIFKWPLIRVEYFSHKLVKYEMSFPTVVRL